MCIIWFGCPSSYSFTIYLLFISPQISGDFSNVQDALYNATSRLRDNLFASTQNSAGIRNISVSCDTSPYGRLGDSVSLGGQPTIGISHTMNKHISSQSIDYLGHSRSLDSPLPGLWTPPVNFFSVLAGLALQFFPYQIIFYFRQFPEALMMLAGDQLL